MIQLDHGLYFRDSFLCQPETQSGPCTRNEASFGLLLQIEVCKQVVCRLETNSWNKTFSLLFGRYKNYFRCSQATTIQEKNKSLYYCCNNSAETLSHVYFSHKIMLRLSISAKHRSSSLSAPILCYCQSRDLCMLLLEYNLHSTYVAITEKHKFKLKE